MKLAVIPGNEPAAVLYRRNGFVVTDELGSLLPDGVTREQVMAKPLHRLADEPAFWSSVREEHASPADDERSEYPSNAPLGDQLTDASDDALSSRDGW